MNSLPHNSHLVITPRALEQWKRLTREQRWAGYKLLATAESIWAEGSKYGSFELRSMMRRDAKHPVTGQPATQYTMVISVSVDSGYFRIDGFHAGAIR